MKSRTSGSISEDSYEVEEGPTEGTTPSARILRAAAVGAIAGGIIGAGAAIARSKSPVITESARKLKDWAKLAARSPLVRYLVEDAAQVIASSKGATRSGRSASARRRH